MKSLKKFGVNISESELNELIANSYSLHEVTDFLIKKFNLKSLISSNLPRFISCYWELMFHDKWPIEMIIDMMNEARIPILDEEYQEYFTRYTDLFNHAKELFFNLQLLKNSDLRSDFKESFSKWLTKFLIFFQKIIPFPQEQMDLFLELSAFIKQNPHFSATESTNSFLKSKLNFVHAQILYLGNSKENAFKFLDELHNEDVPVSEVLFQKLQLLVEKFV